MHPLLSQRRSLSAYLLFWACLSVVPYLLLQSAAPAGGLLLSEICTVSFALVTLPSYYLCRALPLGPGRLARVTSAQSAAAVVWSLVFLVCWKAFVEVFAYVPAWRGLPNEVDHAEPALLGVGVLFYLLVATFHYMLAELDLRREAIEREGALALTAQRAELQALRAQVHPHFLFNALNTVNALIGYDTAKAREACVLLADYLRGTLGAQEQALVPLAEEWALCERYLAVEKLRLGDRLVLDVALDSAARACLVPSLLLQPLVENAMTHGISRVEEPAPLLVRAFLRGERLVVVLENGIDPEPRRRPGGVGLANIRARLAAHYGEEALLHVERNETKFRVVLKVPVRAPATPEAR